MIGVFEFVLLIVLISTAGKVLTSRSSRPRLPPGARPEDVEQLNDAVSELHARLTRLEEERDFYRALLDSPDRKTLPEPPGGGVPPDES